MKITYEPFKEIVVKEYVRYENPKDLIYIFAQLRVAGQPVSLMWAKGVMFIHYVLPPATEELMEEYLKGRLYYTNVSFALKPEYEETLEYQKMPVPLINVSSSKLLSELAEWLKKQK